MSATVAVESGILLYDKPKGVTSHDIVDRVRRERGGKVGHAGTLDPDATGVLLLGVGRATKLLRYLSPLGKAYVGEVVFGVETSTLDAAGARAGIDVARMMSYEGHGLRVSSSEVRAALAAGDLRQTEADELISV